MNKMNNYIIVVFAKLQSRTKNKTEILRTLFSSTHSFIDSFILVVVSDHVIVVLAPSFAIVAFLAASYY